MDALYQACCFDVLATVNPEQEQVTFKTTEGLLHECYAVSIECGEGCRLPVDGFGDITLDRIVFGPLPD